MPSKVNGSRRPGKVGRPDYASWDHFPSIFMKTNASAVRSIGNALVRQYICRSVVEYPKGPWGIGRRRLTSQRHNLSGFGLGLTRFGVASWKESRRIVKSISSSENEPKLLILWLQMICEATFASSTPCREARQLAQEEPILAKQTYQRVQSAAHNRRKPAHLLRGGQ